jgi:hypothetical protein
MSCQHSLLSLHHGIKCNPRAKLSIRASLSLQAGERSDCDKTQKELWMRGRQAGAVAALLHTGGRRNEGGPWETPGVLGTLGTRSPKITSSLSAVFSWVRTFAQRRAELERKQGNILPRIPDFFCGRKITKFLSQNKFATFPPNFFFSFFKFVRYGGLVSIHKRN